MKCPICNKEIQKYEDYLDTILVEYEYKCSGHYEEYFLAGNYRIVIGNTAFEWTYKEEPPIEEIHKSIERMKFIAELESMEFPELKGVKGAARREDLQEFSEEEKRRLNIV